MVEWALREEGGAEQRDGGKNLGGTEWKVKNERNEFDPILKKGTIIWET